MDELDDDVICELADWDGLDFAGDCGKIFNKQSNINGRIQLQPLCGTVILSPSISSFHWGGGRGEGERRVGYVIL